MKWLILPVRSRGFSLIETLIVMVLLAVLLSLATASLAPLLESRRLSALTRGLLDDLRLTRSEAIRRGQRVAMCTAASEDACSSRTGWHQGWLIFVDGNNNGMRDPAELIVRYQAAAPVGWLISGNTPVSRYVSYDALGATRLIGGGFQAGTLTICRGSATATEARKVVINSIGRPRSQEVAMPHCA
jgi:type IV fimbrial biogenesis protein FimT